MIINGVETKDISVIVQGAVDKTNTPLCLKSIRKYIPGAEIVLSTWEGTPLNGLDYDEVVLNEDPGGFKDKKTSFVNNLNRQLISTVNGLKKAKGIYTLKVRNDLIFRSHSFLNYVDIYSVREENYKLFKKRVIFCSYFYKKYLGEIAYNVHPVPFHLSDWLVFGLKEDLMLLFDVDLALEPENTNYLYDNILKTMKIDMFGASHQYAPEQYILYQCIKKNMSMFPNLKNIMDYNSDNIEFSNRFAANNCTILDPHQISVYCNKNGIDPYKKWSHNELRLPYYVWEGLYRHDVFLDDYIKYCDANYQIPKFVRFNRWLYLKLHRFFTAQR